MPSSATTWVYLVSLLAPVLAAIVLALYYPRLPAVIPVHFNAAGEPDGFADKSWLTVLAVPVVALAIAGLFVLMEVVRRQAFVPQRVGADVVGGVAVPFSESAHLRAQHSLAATNRWLAWLGVVMSVGMSAGSVAALIPEYRWLFTPAIALVLVGATLVVLVGLIITFRVQAQGEEKYPPDADERERDRLLSPADAQREVYRLGGVVYSNPADPMGVGPSYANQGNIDVNIAHPPGMSLYRGLIIFVVGLTVLVLASFTL